MRLTRPSVFAVVVGSLASVGCLNTDQQKEALVLGQDTRSVLTAPGGGASSAKAIRPAAFDPTATGGSGLSVQNSFNRTVPGAGTGSSTGNFVSKLPPPQVGLPPTLTPPAVQGASYGEPMTEPGRTSMPRAATPPPLTALPEERSPFGPPKLEPPLNDPPPVKPVVMTTPAPSPTPDTSGPIRPVMPDLDRGGPLPAPAMSTPVAPLPPALPAAPVPAPGPAAYEPLPVAPAPPTYVPSPIEAPIPGVQSPPKLPPAPPIRPQCLEPGTE